MPATRSSTVHRTGRSTLAVPISVSVGFAVISAAALLAATWAAVRRQRRELAVLRTFGFSSAQVHTSVASSRSWRCSPR
ncbi:MAG: FtsX-like permease family protein [Microthrixaceae bacterium]